MAQPFNFDVAGTIAQQMQGSNALGELGRFMLQKKQVDFQQAQARKLEDRLKAQEDEKKRMAEATRAAMLGALTKDQQVPVFGEETYADGSAQAPDISAMMMGMGGQNLSARGIDANAQAPAQDKPWMGSALPKMISDTMVGREPEPEPVRWEIPKSPVDVMRKRQVQVGTKTEKVPNENWMGDAARAVAGVDPELAIRLNQGAMVEQGAKKSAQVEAATEAVNNAMNAMYQPMKEGSTPEEAELETDRRFVSYVTEMNKYNALAGKPLVDVNSYEMQKQKQDLWRHQIDNNLEMSKQNAKSKAEKDAADRDLKLQELDLKKQELAHEKAMDWSSLGLERQKLDAAKATGKFNDGQLNSAAFAVRMSKSIPVIFDTEDKLDGEDRTLLALGKSPLSDNGRLYYNALRDVAMAHLRKFSGAAITDGEMKSVFEQFGRSLLDGDSVRAQKLSALQTELDNMKALSGGAYAFVASKQTNPTGEQTPGKPTPDGANTGKSGRKRVQIDDGAEF